MLFITDIKFRSEKSTFHHWTKSSGFCDLNHSIEAWFLAAYPGQTTKLSWILSPTSAKNFIDKKKLFLELEMWTETDICSSLNVAMVKSHFKDTTTTKLNTLGHFTKFTSSITTFAAAVLSHHSTRFLPRCVIWSNKDCEDYLKHYLTVKKIHTAL